MKLPVAVLQSLAAAVALVGMAGCNFTCSSSPAPSSSTSTDPNAAQNPNPDNQPCEHCQPEPCPACGRG
jgi:hypothetical protein